MEVKMKKFPTIAVALSLLLSVTAGAQNNRVHEAMKKKSSRSRGIWKFSSR